MTDTTTVSVRLPSSLKQQLELLAESTKRSKSFCIVEAVRAYLETESWQIQAIQEGVASADKGMLADHAKVKEWVESWDTEHEREKPEAAETGK
ncbi:MAG: ribbon-helix-helix protein, CopG family [Desulfobacteraceae bacterium]|nr:ribbon-helix-helix protein, CopG family [Desulfobacteraceae bacterium]